MVPFLKPILGNSSASLRDLKEVYSFPLPEPSVIVVSGSIDFYSKLRSKLEGHSLVMWVMQQVFRDRPFAAWRKVLGVADKRCRSWGLNPVQFRHADYGGATNASHIIGFSSAFGVSDASFSHEQHVTRTLRHFWKPAANSPYKDCSSMPTVVGDHRRPVTDKGLLRIEGLLPVSSPLSEVCGPSVFRPGKLIRRRLTREELLAIFDVLSVLENGFSTLGQWSAVTHLPFETAPSPVIFTSLFRRLWGVGGGEEAATASKAVQEKSQEDNSPPDPSPTALETVVMEPKGVSAALKVDLGIELYPNIRDLDLDCSSDDDTSMPGLSYRSASSSDASLPSLPTYRSFDTESDDDSFMPRRRKPVEVDVNKKCDWEFLDDVSVGSATLETEEATESVSSFGAENHPADWSVGSASATDSTGSYQSIASAETLFTYTSAASSELFKPKADEATLRQVEEDTIGKKAVKADDAEVPTHLWNDRVKVDEASPSTKTKALDGCRELELRTFRRALYLDCMEYLEDNYGLNWQQLEQKKGKYRLTPLGREVDAIRNILWHASETNFFEYLSGSRVHYFRWADRYQKLARDGVPILYEKAGPSKKQRQPEFPDPNVKEQVRAKVLKVIRRRYMVRARTTFDIKSLIKYFGVPKGLRDIRIVYDATASGLNEAVWAPSFWLPTIDSLVRSLDSSSWMADRDIGDMFLNFQLHESAWCYAGVDIQPIMTEEEKSSKKARWYHWVRNAMGFGPSPYNSIKMALIAEEVIRGDKMDPLNPFQWKAVRLNLPGTSTYDPTTSWIAKIREDGLVACELFTFVDDERVTGATEELAWMAAHVMAAKQAYLGIQDAARKADKCSQQPRAWAGAVVHVVENKGVCVLTSDEKWQKMKRILLKWDAVVSGGASKLDHKDLLSDRGFLVYVTRAYPPLIPYVKGFHLTAEMWRGNRDKDGWKLPPNQRSDALVSDSGDAIVERDEDEAAVRYSMRRKFGPVPPPHAPADGLTPPAPRLSADLKALIHLTSAVSPPLRVVRPKRVAHVFYGFGDASGTGKGSTRQGFHVPSSSVSGAVGPSTHVHYKVGVWSTTVEAESSNYRELRNLVEDVETEAAAGGLVDTEMFLFTDNSTAESAYHKGSSSSKKLHELVLRLHKVALDYSIILHVIHVSGTRMIAQGTDGCSRGVLMEGVMAGQDMLSFIDLDKPATLRAEDLLPWIRSWCGCPNIEPLTPEEWFQKGHGIIGGHKDKHGVWIPDHEPAGRMHLWAPPPAVADAALEELLKARHKRTDTFHLVVIPRLMSPRWRRLFHKAVDLSFVVDPGNAFWPANMFEPLFVDRGASNVPQLWWMWGGSCAKCAKKVTSLQGVFCGNYSSSRGDWPPCKQAWHADCYTCQGTKMFPLNVLKDEDGDVWEGQESRAERLNTGVAGAHAVVAFQCEICWFRNLEQRNPHPVRDRKYLICLRRANLDAINARAAGTIKAHVDFIKASVKICREVNRTPNFPPRGPFPLSDPLGMGCAVDMLLKCLHSKGRINDHIQFGTMRKVRGSYTKMWETSPIGATEGATFAGHGKRVRSTTCPTQSDWFVEFLEGAEDRMGYATKNQLAVPIQAVVAQLNLIEADIETAESEEHAHSLIKLGSLITILTAASLRGHEGFYLDISGTRKYISRGADGVIPANVLKNKLLTEAQARDLPQVCICLMGKFKGETGERYHSIVLANESISGLKPRYWVERLLATCDAEGRSSGSAFNNADGSPPSPSEYNALVRQYFKVVHEENPDLIDRPDDWSRYGISRTYRKTAESRARRAGIPKDQVETVNRWRKVERAKGKMPQFDMADHYSDAKQLGTLTWRYSRAL